MAETAKAPWLTIVGIGEDGWAGLSELARRALSSAAHIIGPPRHLALLPPLTGAVEEWPVPFADGIPLVLRQRGRATVMLASGDPFWFGAGSSVTGALQADEWTALPSLSTFSLAAARLGWALQDTVCLGLHAAPLSRLRPHLTPGRKALILLRDGAAVCDLAAYLDVAGFGASTLHVMEALGGPRERLRASMASGFALDDIRHPVAVALDCAGAGEAMPTASGLDDSWFQSDGQLTKRPVRALTLSALAPRAGDLLWDIGAGSGSIAIEWLLSHPANRAVALEADTVRAANARANAQSLGVDRLKVIEGRAPDTLPEGPAPDAVFIGGGLSHALLEALWPRLRPGTRLVSNAVTLESEALLTQWRAAKGGALLRIELADAAPIGNRQGWKSRYPVVQWNVTV